MAKAQQKPKKVSGTRNSERRNGKAWGSHAVPKATGKSIMGYKRERVVKWAQEAGVELETYVTGMKVERDLKKYTMRQNRAAFARQIKGTPDLYRKGVLVHKPTPHIPRQRQGAGVLVEGKL